MTGLTAFAKEPEAFGGLKAVPSHKEAKYSKDLILGEKPTSFRVMGESLKHLSLKIKPSL